MDETTICNCETNRTSPQLRFIPRIIVFLGYSPYDTESGTIGKRIISKCQAMGLTRKELTRHLGVDPGTLGRWERGERHPSDNTGLRLKRLLCATDEQTNALGRA